MQYYKKGFDTKFFKKGVQKMFLRESQKELGKIPKKLKCSLEILISVLGLIIANFILYQLLKIEFNIKSILMGVILNLLFSCLLVGVYRQKKIINKMKEEINTLTLKSDSLMELNDNIRSFKHDFNNIIQAIDGYILLGDMDALKTYFSKLLKECNYVKNLELLTGKVQTNPAIYGVLLDKCRVAEGNNIDMNIDMFVDYSDMNEKAYDLSRIIGILLDNAIEATLECEKKVINVQFKEGSSENKKKIVIENTYKDNGFDTEMIFEKDYTTKKEKGNSGLGLWKVKEIISKDDEVEIQTIKDENTFKQELEIFV